MTNLATTGSARVRARHEVAAAADLRSAGVLLFVLAAAFLIVTMLAASIAPDYDFKEGAISDLGVIDQTALLFNGLLVGMGVLNIAAGYLFFRSHRRRWLLGLYVIAGIGTIGAGLFPLDTGGLHATFALVAFVVYNLEGLGTAALVAGPIRSLGFIAGAIGLIYTVLMVIGDSGNTAVFGPYGHGGSERMIAYPVMAWLIALGGYLMAGRTSEQGLSAR
ncbi:MAG TPA: DUF998 domain-containing protein [Candidatus Limnocylindrales bacterium]|nr:DUF998 domain-containing protein [Candidatus Limnocylindrales bacterium]